MAARRHCPSLMGRLLEGVARIFGFRYEEQTIELNHGQHEVLIETGYTPERVWISFEEDGFYRPVCWGSVDVVGTEITEDGFVLYADVASTSRKIRWFASLSDKQRPKHPKHHR